MATVISYTEDKIKELLGPWDGVALTQDEINAKLQQMRTSLDSQGAMQTEFNQVVRPQLEAAVAESSIQVSELNETVVPSLRQDLTQTQTDVQDLNTVTIPSIQQDVSATIQTIAERPKAYPQDEEPTNPDDDGRYLVVGDTWFDTDNNNQQSVWNGVEWSTFSVDVAEFSLTAEKFKTSTHMIY